jgi:TPR repeat protein
MVIDPKFPWKLPRVDREFPPYPYRMSLTEWQALLDKAKQGNPEAEWEVAGRYDEGCKDKKGRILVRRSARKAAEWLRRSAEHGCTSAQNNLRVLLGDTEYVGRNRREALVWLKRAFRAGEDIAANNLAITHRQEGNFKKAVEWFRRAVTSGDDYALIQLGIHYYWGKGIRKNATAAVRCFRKATRGKNICESGRDEAFFYLGIAYLEGKGVTQSIPTARKLLQRANIDSDHPAAHRALQELTRSAS